MSDFREITYPNTPEGRAAAVRYADAQGNVYWEEYVDFTPKEAIDDEMLVLKAVADTIIRQLPTTQQQQVIERLRSHVGQQMQTEPLPVIGMVNTPDINTIVLQGDVDEG